MLFIFTVRFMELSSSTNPGICTRCVLSQEQRDLLDRNQDLRGMACGLTGTVSNQDSGEHQYVGGSTQRSDHFVHVVILQCALKRIHGLFSTFGWNSNLLKHTILYLRNNMLQEAFVTEDKYTWQTSWSTCTPNFSYSIFL